MNLNKFSMLNDLFTWNLRVQKRYFIVFFFFFLTVSNSLFPTVEKGSLNLSFLNRSYIYGQTQSSGFNKYENIFHLDIKQSYLGLGNFSAWVDGLSSEIDKKVSQWRIRWSGFKFKGSTLNVNFGDSYFQFTNLNSRFINTYHPYLYMRGVNFDLTSNELKITVFGGRTAFLRGLLGTTYDVSSQTMLGFISRYQKNDNFIVGLGLIHANGEEDPGGEKIVNSNTIIMADSEYNFLSWLKLLGEFRHSFYQKTNEINKTTGVFLRTGPMISTQKINLEANLLYADNEYRFLTERYQVEKDKKGIFTHLNYKANESLTLFGNIEKFRDNIDDDPGINTIDSFQTFSGLSLFSQDIPSITARYEYSHFKSRQNSPRPEDIFRKGIYTQVSQQMGSFFPYFRFWWVKTDSKLSRDKSSSSRTVYLGFRHRIKRNTHLWAESVWDHKKNDFTQTTVNNFHIRTGLRRTLNLNFDINAETLIRRYGYVKPITSLETYFWMNYRLPWNTELRVDFRSNIPLSGSSSFKNYWFTLKINKNFSWGTEPRIIGKGFGDEDLSIGRIEGTVYEDTNNNQRLDPEDHKMKGIKIIMEEGSFTTTDSDGNFRFPYVAEGHHQVSIDERKIPAQYYIVTPVRQSIDIYPRSTQKVNFILASGSTINGKIILDSDLDGNADPEEKGLPDVLIILEPINVRKPDNRASVFENMILNTYTDSEGNFIFDNIFPGEYELRLEKETLPDGAEVSKETPLKINLQPGQTISDWNILITPRPIIIKKKESKN